MEYEKGVQSAVEPKEIEIDDAHVYINLNIRAVKDDIDGDEFIGFEFDQMIYGKDEYIAVLSEQNQRNGELLSTILGTDDEGSQEQLARQVNVALRSVAASIDFKELQAAEVAPIDEGITKIKGERVQ